MAAMAAAAPLGCQRSDDGRKVIRVTRNIGGREGFRIHFEAWKAAFEKQNHGWTMELIDLGNAEGSEFYKSRIATGDLPEIVMTWQLARMLADGGHLVPFADDYYNKFGIALPPPYKGKRYTTQGGIQVQGIAVNKKMWTDAGITDAPKTWADFMAALAKLKAKGYMPLSYGAKDWTAAMPLEYAIATSLYYDRPTPDKPSFTQRRNTKQVRFADEPEMRIILKNLIDLIEEFAPKGAASDGYNEEQRDFYTGKAATWIMGCWIGGDIEPNKVDFDIDYWPIPSMNGRPPLFLQTSEIPSGWAITTSAAGDRLEKARAAIDLFYDPHVYQLFLNGESQVGAAAKVPVKGPQSTWPPAQKFFDSMIASTARYGYTPGFHIALDDMPPLNFMPTLAAVCQEILAGNRDIDKLLKIIDDEWDAARKGE